MNSHPDAARMAHFHALDHDQQAQAIRGLHLTGQSPHTIARTTGLSDEQVQLLLEQTA